MLNNPLHNNPHHPNHNPHYLSSDSRAPFQRYDDIQQDNQKESEDLVISEERVGANRIPDNNPNLVPVSLTPRIL